MKIINITRLNLLTIFLCIAIFTPFTAIKADNIIVNSLSSYTSAQSNLKEGDTIIWSEGIYENIQLNVSANGIRVIAESPGRVVFTGNSTCLISGDNNIFSGFQYRDGSTTSTVVSISGDNNLITQLNIYNYGSHYYLNIKEGSQYNTVSYSNFEKKPHASSGAEGTSIFQIQVSPNRIGYHTVSHCSFKNHTAPAGAGGDYGMEALRIGYSYQAENISRSLIEYNYFSKCMGDGEIISSKARENVYRYNTFIDNGSSHFTLRHGDVNVIYSNFFINGIGLRIKEGQGHVVYNNYFNTGNYTALNLMNYSADPLDSITIAYNTFVNCGSISLGSSGSYDPENITFANNIFNNNINTIFSSPTGTEKWIGNIANGSLGISIPDGITSADPLLVLNPAGFYDISEGSPAINSAKGGYPAILDVPVLDDDPEVMLDLMKTDRSADTTQKDVGCTEYPSNPLQLYVNESNTGPDYIHDDPVNFLYIDVIGSGSVILDPPGGIYENGTRIKIEAEPNPENDFDGWEGDFISNNILDSILMDSDKHISANFSSSTLYEISISITGNGQVVMNPPGANYKIGTEVELTAIPDSGWIFQAWTGQLSGDEPVTSLVVYGILEGLATFIPDDNTSIINSGSSKIGPVSFYPNPVKDNLNLLFRIKNFGLVECKIYDLAGRIVGPQISGEYIAGEHLISLNLSSLPDGLYLCSLRTEENFFLEKIQKVTD